MDRSEQFRAAAERHNHPRERAGWRYPPELRALAVAHARDAREEGRSWSAIAADLDISALTLRRWCESGPSPASRRLLPVKLVESRAASEEAAVSLCVVTPAGWRIEGLGWPQVLELVRLVR